MPLFGLKVQMTLFVPSGAIRFAASSIIQITHNHAPNTEIAYLTGMAKNNKDSKQSIYGKSNKLSMFCFRIEKQNGCRYKRVFISVGSQFWSSGFCPRLVSPLVPGVCY